MHAAQGVTADTTHAVLSDTATRALSYVALTRGRDSNTAYLYRRISEHEYVHDRTALGHVTYRGSRNQAAQLLRAVVANDNQSLTAHDALDAHEALPLNVRSAGQWRTIAVRNRRADYLRWRQSSSLYAAAACEAPTRDVGLSHGLNYEMDL